MLVAIDKYFNALPLEDFLAWHVQDMTQRKWPVAKIYVQRDLVALADLAAASDAVLVTPTHKPQA